MRNSIQILIVCGLMLCTAFGQRQSDSVQSVMSELAAQQGSAPAAAEPVPVAAASVHALEAPAASVDVPALVEESRAQFVAGDRDGAEAGFQAALKADSQNELAAIYLKQIEKTRHQQTEESAMDEVAGSWGGMEMRYYPLEGKVLENLGLAAAQEPAHIESKFPFVTFPDGSSAIYRPGLKKLFVRNTAANLQTVEAILANLGRAEQQASAEQVEIETRFVEFNEGALEELGFNWSNSNDNSEDINLLGNWSLSEGQDLFTGALRGSPVPFEQAKNANANYTEVNSRAGSSRIDNWNVNRIEDMFSSNAGELNLSGNTAGSTVDILIRALDQTAGADVLSAPSVVTLSGESATITVGERHFYPEVYEAGETQGTVVHVKYEGFKEKILGVEMTVTPTIKGNEIQMKINPKITELIGWQKFELSPADTSYTYYQYRVGQQFEHEPVVAQLPLFSRREIKTEILAESGSTIGMGGLIGEKTEAFSDRVPVLGSIPLVGRLFRSEGERTVKRNLMIFVTASKVAPSGRVISERSFE